MPELEWKILYNWVFNNWGNIASITGVFFTIYVLIISKKVVEAVKETKKLIERKSVAQELKECGDDLSLLKINSENLIWPVASFICNKLMLKLTFVNNRWAVYFHEETKENINLIITQLETLNSQYRKFAGRSPTQIELSGVVSATIRVSTLLAAEVGKYESSIEK